MHYVVGDDVISDGIVSDAEEAVQGIREEAEGTGDNVNDGTREQADGTREQGDAGTREQDDGTRETREQGM